MLDAAIRETTEEVGLHLRAEQVRFATVVHHQGPGGQHRVGWFFAALPGWSGQPVNREPKRHSELLWVDPGAPSAEWVAYTWAGVTAWRAGARAAVHLQAPGSPVHYDPAFEHELTLLA